jgi:hypothetical protein
MWKAHTYARRFLSEKPPALFPLCLYNRTNRDHVYGNYSVIFVPSPNSIFECSGRGATIPLVTHLPRRCEDGQPLPPD